MRTVARLNVAPVKGLALVHPDRIRLEGTGVAENRRFCVLDGDGEPFTASEDGALLRVGAEYDPATERLTLTFPDGTAVAGDAAALGEAVETPVYHGPVPAHVLEGPWAAALSAYAGRDLRLARFDRSGDGNDEFPVSLLSTASVDELTRRAGREERVDSRRFRMLVEVDGCARPHEEDGWIGGRVRIGEATVEVAQQDPRCRVITLSPETGAKDLDTLKVIAGYRGVRGGDGIDFGVYANVLAPGTIAVGDPVEPLGDGP